jgi:oxygen-dependent protoporphyrinogen oxidase
MDLVTSPLRGLLIWPIFREALLPSNRESFREAWLSDSPTSSRILANGEDESVHSFLTRRFGAEFARVFGSSLVHGIYAADSRRISVRAAFGTLWQMEGIGRGSVVRGFGNKLLGRGRKEGKRGGYNFGEVVERLEGAAVFSFTNGIETITRTLEHSLRLQSGLQLRLGAGVTAVSYNRRKEAFEVR